MAAVFYTTSEAVRAAIGVSIREIPDATLLDLDLETQLELEADVVYPTHAALKAAIEALTATSDQIKTWKYLKLFCQYQATVFLLPGLQNLLAQKLTDGDVEMQRFMKDSLIETEDKLTALRDKYRSLLNPTDYPTTGFVNPLIAATPDYDPVTNEGA